MVRSMTGYGKAESHFKNKSIKVEIKALNGKNLDVFFRVPQEYKEIETVFRNAVSKVLERGKIEVIIKVENLDDSTAFTINKKLFKKYYRELNELKEELRIDDDNNLISSILRLPDVLKSEIKEIDEKEIDILNKCVIQALEKVDKYRIDEGKSLEKDLKINIEAISKILKEIEPYEKERIEHIRSKFEKRLSEISQYDDNRLEQELIYYIEKLDINEEKVRLVKHIDYFKQTLKDKKSSNGKRLGFIVQEIGREINTIGSKANEVNIQKIVVQMKEELEKIREQIHNIL